MFSLPHYFTRSVYPRSFLHYSQRETNKTRNANRHHPYYLRSSFIVRERKALALQNRNRNRNQKKTKKSSPPQQQQQTPYNNVINNSESNERDRDTENENDSDSNIDMYDSEDDDEPIPDSVMYESLLALDDHVIRPGLHKDTIQKLNDSHTRTASSPLDNCNTCSICLESYHDHHHHHQDNQETILTLPTCLHEFHTHCCFRWFERSKTCPCCRKEVAL